MQTPTRVFYDDKQNRYTAAKQLDCGETWVCLSSADDHILKIYSQVLDQKALSARIDRLIGISQTSPLRDLIVFPTAFLVGLKQKELGYVCRPHTLSTLQRCIHRSTDPPRVWYAKTGGIIHRLKIAYTLLLNLEKIHDTGICLIDICPANTFVQPYDPALTPDKQPHPIVQFGGAEANSTCAYPPLISAHPNYSDPLVHTGMSAVTSISDTYSCAVMIFELLTACHPFIGEAAEQMTDQELSDAIAKGSLDYIGDPCGSNTNEDFDDVMQFVLSEDLSDLFCRMFTSGRLNAALRPSISKFKSAIIKSLNNIIKSDSCGHEYPYNDDLTCPFCGHTPTALITAELKSITECSVIPSYLADNASDLQVSETISSMVLHDRQTHCLSQSFFDPHITAEKRGVGIWIKYLPDKEEIAIRNSFPALNITVCGILLHPYGKTTRRQSAETCLSLKNHPTITIELPDNALLGVQEITDIRSPIYGTIRRKWIITIKKRSYI